MGGNEHYEALRRDVRDMAAALTRILAERPPTPADAHALQEQADRERRDFAWLHQCGVLNHGYWSPGSMCTGCRFSVDKADHVDAHYRLVPVEGLGDEGRV